MNGVDARLVVLHALAHEEVSPIDVSHVLGPRSPIRDTATRDTGRVFAVPRQESCPSLFCTSLAAYVQGVGSVDVWMSRDG